RSTLYTTAASAAESAPLPLHDALPISDAARAQALAGVMGGAESEVGEATTRIVLESAWFAPEGVRRTARRHALHSEASHRFERGDRKSTRLNSSHVKISYAVFCLKKKK